MPGSRIRWHTGWQNRGKLEEKVRHLMNQKGSSAGELDRKKLQNWLKRIGTSQTAVASAMKSFRETITHCERLVETAKRQETHWRGTFEDAVGKLQEGANQLRQVVYSQDGSECHLCPVLVTHIDTIVASLDPIPRDKEKTKEFSQTLKRCRNLSVSKRSFEQHLRNADVEQIRRDFDKLGIPLPSLDDEPDALKVTDELFDDRYCAIYADYSEKLPWYGPPADDAAKIAKWLLQDRRSHRNALDVGCGFGTSAYFAAKNGFEQVLCIDRSEAFGRLFDLLWSDDDQFDKRLERYLSAEVLHVSASYLGRSLVATRDYFARLLREKRDEFRTVSGVARKVLWANYWRLDDALNQAGFPERTFNLIVLHNVLHWVLLNLDRQAQERLPHVFRTPGTQVHTFGSTYLADVLRILTQRLAANGLIVILEPSLYWKDFQGDEAAVHERFNRMRFAEQDCYKTIRKEMDDLIAESELIRKSSEKDKTSSQDYVRFRAADFEVAAKALGCEFALLRMSYKAKEEKWPWHCLGENMMVIGQTYALSTLAQAQALSTVYEKVRDLVQTQAFDSPLIDCEYFVLIGRGLKEKLSEFDPRSVKNLNGKIFPPQ